EPGDADAQSGPTKRDVIHKSPRVSLIAQADARSATRAWRGSPRRGGLSADTKIRDAARPLGAAARRRITPPMRIDQAVNIEDLQRMAKGRLPEIAFDVIQGGLED